MGCATGLAQLRSWLCLKPHHPTDIFWSHPCVLDYQWRSQDLAVLGAMVGARTRAYNGV